MSDQASATGNVTGINLYAGKASGVPALNEGFELNRPNMDFREGKVRIKAFLDLEGLEQLQSSLGALRTLMKPKTAEAMLLESDQWARRPDPFAWR